MIVSIIIVLIVALVVIALWVGAMQQYKEKQDAERRKELTKQKVILGETEEALMNSVNIPLSENMVRALQRRIYEALNTMVINSPNSKALKGRLSEAKTHLSNPVQGSNNEVLSLPNSDQQLVSLIQSIKRLRSILRSEHSKGRVDSQIFVVEDRHLEKLQLRINIENQIKRGLSARSASMVGSARQYFEKARATLNAVTYSDEYITSKHQEIEGYLEAISVDLKASNASALKKKTQEEQDDLDILFAPKKKW